MGDEDELDGGDGFHFYMKENGSHKCYSQGEIPNRNTKVLYVDLMRVYCIEKCWYILALSYFIYLNNVNIDR